MLRLAAYARGTNHYKRNACQIPYNSTGCCEIAIDFLLDECVFRIDSNRNRYERQHITVEISARVKSLVIIQKFRRFLFALLVQPV
jgi:hypothetical protein